MSIRQLFLLLTATTVVACSDSTGPSRSALSLSFSTLPAAASQAASTMAPNFDVTVSSGGNTLVITRAQVVQKKIELKRSASATCPDSALHEGDCDEMELGPVLVDLRNVYRPDEMSRRGFAYEGIGRARD